MYQILASNWNFIMALYMSYITHSREKENQQGTEQAQELTCPG
jgi:hypothetical protein